MLCCRSGLARYGNTTARLTFRFLFLQDSLDGLMQGLFGQEQEVLPHMGFIAVRIDSERFCVFIATFEEVVVGLTQFLLPNTK